jgi:flavin-dependent dehydrogenase
VYQNVLLAGDAAGLIDPLMGYGMMPAIVSGYYAAKYSVEAIRKDDYLMLKKYETEIRKRFNKKSSYVYRMIFESLDNKDLNLVLKMATEWKNKGDIDRWIYAFIVFWRNMPGSGKLLVKSGVKSLQQASTLLVLQHKEFHHNANNKGC